jgi:hypothetical protein
LEDLICGWVHGSDSELGFDDLGKTRFLLGVCRETLQRCPDVVK